MNRNSVRAARAALLGAALAGAGAVLAQDEVQQPQAALAPQPTRIEAYASHHRLSGGYADWGELGVRATRVTGPHVLQGELAATRRFGESGVFLGLGDVYTFDEDWYGQLAVGAGDGASYLPRWRVDAFLNRKLLARRQLVATLGLAWYRAPDGHEDRSVGLGAIYYFDCPLVVQGEYRRNVSEPGSVATRRRFLALTWGRESELQVTARHAWGEEGWQPLGAGQAIMNFRSRESSLGVRRRFGAWGVSLRLEHYRNPAYVRRGVVVSLFRDFP